MVSVRALHWSEQVSLKKITKLRTRLPRFNFTPKKKWELPEKYISRLLWITPSLKPICFEYEVEEGMENTIAMV